MLWSNLKEDLCPKCDGLLIYQAQSGLYICEEVDCDFTISKSRMEDVIMSLDDQRKYMSRAEIVDNNNEF